MSKWLKGGLWLLAVFAVVWLAVIIHWQSSTRLPSETDLVLYLGVLPLAIFGVVWGVHSLVTAPPAKPAPLAAAPKADTAEVAAQAAKKTFEQERTWTLGLVATALHTAQGASSAEVLAKLKEGAINQELDAELTTPDGFPVFAARIVELDFSSTQEALAQWQANSVHAKLRWTEQQLRALHLATQAVNELAQTAAQHPDVVLYAKNQVNGRDSKEDAVVPLRLIFLWPGKWSAAHQAAASAWAKQLVMQNGWPEHRLVIQTTKPAQKDPIALLDFVTVTAHRAKLPTVGILMACDSGIDQDYVDDLYAQGQLFGGKNPQGLKPGEVAAGLLFADTQQCQKLGFGPYSRLHRASLASRDKSADARGRSSAELLASVTTLALETSGLTASEVPVVCADHDHRPSREAELAEMLNEKFPGLEPSKDVLKVAQACGSMQQMATTAALCVAHQYVIDEQAPALCLSLHDALWRAAVVLNIAPQAKDEAG
jgi:hypothetical protein